ncbi:unnamed protein product [Caretta caretta]
MQGPLPLSAGPCYLSLEVASFVGATLFKTDGSHQTASEWQMHETLVILQLHKIGFEKVGGCKKNQRTALEEAIKILGLSSETVRFCDLLPPFSVTGKDSDFDFTLSPALIPTFLTAHYQCDLMEPDAETVSAPRQLGKYRIKRGIYTEEQFQKNYERNTPSPRNRDFRIQGRVQCRT